MFPATGIENWQYVAPNPNQVKAIVALQERRDEEIVAWLAFAKRGGFQLQSRNWTLSREIVGAFLTLGNCEDVLVLHWIHEARAGGHADGDIQKAGIYWCTGCGKNKPKCYKNSDDWRREEKQHEATYVCMLGGISEMTNLGFKCTFCNATNPNNRHFEKHSIHACVSASGHLYSCKRRCDMVKHLAKIHGVNYRPQAEALASQRKHTLEKQAWSCGFCVTTFSDFQQRLKHLQLHFEQGKTLADWNFTTVIQGLLQQPGIDEAWKAKLAVSLPGVETSDLVWLDSASKELQYKLEVGPSEDEGSAEALVEAAYATYLLNWTFPEQ
ncbi:hypothetical protein OEA41_010788 [Lepraria neglecta]|uniref:C2H2-type domain-containing protein n=1 Tax=Lepraria neglecta TaxID=209136 RepID=A0AAD9YYH8_9LECA|nr:hypothetical protein OEA41_010788 [Lepraria neglecta]